MEEAKWTGLDRFIPSLMNRIMAQYNERMREVLSREGVSVVQMRVVCALADRGPLTINALAEIALAPQSTISRTIETLSAAGRVERMNDPEDNRVRIVRLTPAGEGLAARFVPTMTEAQDLLLAPVCAEDRAKLAEVLQVILRG